MARRWIPSRQALLGTCLFAMFIAAVGYAVQTFVRPSDHGPARVTAKEPDGRIGGAGRRGARTVPQRTFAIVGRVVDDTRAAAPRVADVTLSEWSELDMLVPVQTVRTDDTGAFRFDDVPEGRYRVSASAEGWVSQRAGVGISLGDEDVQGVIVVVAAGGRTLRGTIRDRTGGVVAGASVVWQVADTANAGAFATTADDGGAYTLAIPRRPGTLLASADGYADERIALDELDTSTDLALWPAASVAGVVVDRDGTPVADALVYAGAPGATMRRVGQGEASVVVNESGRFELEAVRPGTLVLHAVGPGGVSQPVEVAVPAGQSVGPIQLALGEAFTLRGRVVSHDRTRGLAGFDVSCQSAAAVYAAPGPSDDDGGFAIYGVSGDACQLVAGSPWVSLAGTLALGTRSTDVDAIELPLALGGPLSGRVEPPDAARVELVQSADASTVVAIRPSHADDDGRFSFPYTPLGGFDVRAVATDGRIGRVTPDGPSDDVVVELSVTWTIAGRVEVEGGPLPGPLRIVARGSIGRATVTTRDDGTFTLRGSEAGVLSIAVTDDAGHPLRIVDGEGNRVPFIGFTPTDGATLELAVEPRDGRIDGFVVAGEGERVADARVVAVPDAIPVAERMGLIPASTQCASARAPAAGDAVVTTSDEEGNFRLDGLRRDLVYAVYVEPTDRAGSGCVGRVRIGSRLAVELGSG